MEDEGLGVVGAVVVEDAVEGDDVVAGFDGLVGLYDEVGCCAGEGESAAVVCGVGDVFETVLGGAAEEVGVVEVVCGEDADAELGRLS